MRLAAAAMVVVGACSFDHGAALLPDADSCVHHGTGPWWNKYPYRFRINTGGAPAGYTVVVDAAPLQEYVWGEGLNDIHVLVDHVTEVDRVVGGALYVKVPAQGELWAYVGSPENGPVYDRPSSVYDFAEDFGSDDALARFDLQPPGDWSIVSDETTYYESVLRVTGAGRHPAAIKNLAMSDGEISALVRFRDGTGQQHNGLAARGNNMQPATMDGFVGQLQADVQHARIAEYTDGVSPPAELVTINDVVYRNHWHYLKLRIVGDAITFSFDNQVMTTTKSGADGNLVGLFAHDCDVEFDSVRVRSVIDPEPIATLGPKETYCD